MTWYAYHDPVTGRLLSCGSDGAPAPAGVTRVTLASPVTDTQMWDTTTRAFVPRPAPVLIDRAQDLRDDPGLAAVWTRLTAAQQTTLRNRLAQLLGPQRWRKAGEAVDLA